MVRVSGINGITYNTDKVAIDKVVAPPYDVISEFEQGKLYESSIYNIVKLILGKVDNYDNDKNNRYTRAAKYFEDWMQERALLKSNKPCIYYYIQNYTTAKGEYISRKGFIAKTFIEEFSEGNILPHEYTMGGPKEDRLKLMKACKANFSQIFMVYSDSEQQIEKFVSLQTPLFDVTDDQNIQNILYAIDDEEIIAKIAQVMQDKKLLIADGHHRYETSIAYRDYVRSLNPDYKDADSFNWVMCYFTNLDDDNLRVYPTHRIILKSVDIEELMLNMNKFFTKKEYVFNLENKIQTRESFLKELEEISKKEIAFGLYLKNDNKYILFEISDKNAVNQILEQKEVPDVLKKLDLSVLHKLIITDFLDISEEDQMNQNGIEYIKKEEEAFEAVDNNTAEMVFLLATPKINDIKDVSEAGYRMPQKSTYFYPKLLSGLVINPLV